SNSLNSLPKMAEDIAALREAGAVDASSAIIASVVPSANDEWIGLLKNRLNLDPLILTHETPMPVGIDYPNKTQIGADRLADAAGAFVRHGAPVIVADFGTALTFDIVNSAGDYAGGVIVPGIPLMTSYLHEKTAKLPLVDLRDGSAFPAWGDSTENAMKLGARIGYRGMVREIAAFIRGRVGTAPLVATGGYARWALEGSGIDCFIEPDLTLFGLGTILTFNNKK
ncbi:MAG: type III pantothenate kinase, partial [Kiritimatiellaeota bacterium]|nr:type III pantothenate kinase [Kiritimatiellota bacterium]